MKIIHRYVLREHAGPLTFALTALTSLLLLNYIAKQFGNLVGKGLPWHVIAEFFLLSVPFTVAMTLPMAILIAALYAFSRLAAENEITALKASGVGMASLIIPVVIAATMLGLLMVAFNDQVLPRANHQLSTLQGDIARKKPTFALREQVINEVSPGQFYLRANHLDRYTNLMREVTIYDLSDQMRRRTIYADSGTMSLAPNGSDLQMILYNGWMQEVPRNDPNQLQRLFYKTDRVKVVNVANKFDRDTANAYKSDREKTICELQEEVASGERDAAAAQRDLSATLVALTREATTGRPAAFDLSVPAPSTGNSLPSPKNVTNAPPSTTGKRDAGRLYCMLLDRVESLWGAPVTVASLEAAELPHAAVAVSSQSTGVGPQRDSATGSATQQEVQRDTERQPGQQRPDEQDSAKRDTVLKKDSAKRDTVPKKDSAKRDTVLKRDSARRDTVPKKDSARRDIVPKKDSAKRDSVAGKDSAKGDTVVRMKSFFPPPRAAQPTPDSGQPELVPRPDSVRPGTPVLPATPGATPNVMPQVPSVSGPYGSMISPNAAIDAARNRLTEGQREVNENAVEIHKKFALSFACIVFVLVGAPIALRFPRGGVGLTMGVSLVVFAIYYVGLIAGESLGNRGMLPPFLAMWLPNIILSLVAMLLLARIGREASTSRGGDLSEFFEMLRGAFSRLGRRKTPTTDRQEQVA